MPITVNIKTNDIRVKEQREAAVNCVLSCFENQLPDQLRLLCYFDNEDCESFKHKWGRANRGMFTPVRDHCLADPPWPDYTRELMLAPESPKRLNFRYVVDCAIYLHGSTCARWLALTMTFAHELQHFIQFSTNRKLWAANTVLSNLPAKNIKLYARDIPMEVEARIVSKRIAEKCYGTELVNQHIEAMIVESLAVLDNFDLSDWEFIRELNSATKYNLAEQTLQAFQKHKQYRQELEELLEIAKGDGDPEFMELDLAPFFN